MTIDLTAKERASAEKRAREMGHSDLNSYVRTLVINDGDHLPPEVEAMLIKRMEGPTISLATFKRRLNAKLKAQKKPAKK